MLPTSSEINFQRVTQKQPSLTYSMSLKEERLRGKTDGLEAVQQAIYKILETERYANMIYSWNYGVELKDLFGRSYLYVASELPRRIREALVQDDRITQVDHFEFSRKKGAVSVTFTAHTTYGEIGITKEVNL